MGMRIALTRAVEYAFSMLWYHDNIAFLYHNAPKGPRAAGEQPWLKIFLLVIAVPVLGVRVTAQEAD